MFISICGSRTTFLVVLSLWLGGVEKDLSLSLPDVMSFDGMLGREAVGDVLLAEDHESIT